MSRANTAKPQSVTEGTQSPRACFISHVTLTFPGAAGLVARRGRGGASTAPAKMTLAQANRWLNDNWDAALAHATESTRRLIGRDSV